MRYVIKIRPFKCVSAFPVPYLQLHQSSHVPRCEAVNAPLLFATISTANPRILCTVHPAVDALFFTLVKPDEASGVVLANTCEVYGVSCGPTFQLHGSLSDVQVRGMQLCNGKNIRRKQTEMRIIFQLWSVQPDGVYINCSFISTMTLCMCVLLVGTHSPLFDVFVYTAYSNGYLPH